MSYLIFCSFEVGGFPFRMAETLNRYGVEAYYVFLGRRGGGHDSTEFHYGNERPDWDLSNSFQNILGNSQKIIQRLNQIKQGKQISDCLATGKKAYLLQKAGIKFKYWSYGADIDQECFIHVPLSNHALSQRLIIHPYRVFSERSQARKSLRQATSVMISHYQLERLQRICADKTLFFLPHLFKTTDYQTLVLQKSQSKSVICGQLQAERYFFSAARQVWSGQLRHMTDNKANDVILNSYSIFKKQTGDHHSKLVLVEKGPDVDASKLLSRSLKIDDSVAWVDEMRREELDRYYRGADICFGQFGTRVLSYAALEPLANGTVTISFFNQDNSSVPFYKEGPPILSSRDPKEIAQIMVGILSQKENYSSLSYKAWHWIQDYCSEERFVRSFMKLFEEGSSIGTTIIKNELLRDQ